jgi:hypothetical protein
LIAIWRRPVRQARKKVFFTNNKKKRKKTINSTFPSGSAFSTIKNGKKATRRGGRKKILKMPYI